MIKGKIHYVGVNDRNKHLFEGFYGDIPQNNKHPPYQSEPQFRRLSGKSYKTLHKGNMKCEKKALFLRLFEYRINLNKEVL